MRHFATVFALFYGNFHGLHVRLLDSLNRFGQGLNYMFWFNQVCSDTAGWMLDHFQQPFQAEWSSENVPKYVAMKTMFDRVNQSAPSDWFVWFDDDSYVDRPDWWQRTVKHIEDHRSQNICYLGQKWFVHHLPGQEDFIRKAGWYRGVPWELCPTRTAGIKKPGITFAQGAYWWLRNDVQLQISWPDPRLVHNGGDTLLGEAVRQQGLLFHPFSYGVRINDAKRRGRSDKPAGSSVDIRR